jgi:hypothetical protein
MWLRQGQVRYRPKGSGFNLQRLSCKLRQGTARVQVELAGMGALSCEKTGDHVLSLIELPGSDFRNNYYVPIRHSLSYKLRSIQLADSILFATGNDDFPRHRDRDYQQLGDPRAIEVSNPTIRWPLGLRWRRPLTPPMQQQQRSRPPQSVRLIL